MEQRKVLLIIVSVAIILAAVIGVGLWLFYPRTAPEPDRVTSAGRALEWEPLDYLLGDGEVPGLEADDEPQDGEFVVTYGVAAEDDDETPARTVVTEAQPPARGEDVSSRIPSPGVSASDGALAAPPSAAAPSADRAARDAPRTDEPARVATAKEEAAVRRDPAPAASAPSDPSAARAAPSRDERQDLADRAYWIQVIASPNRDTVEQAQRTLREHQLGTRILTKEIGGTVYFRLRLGPFAVREETEKFLGWVTEIDGFEDSMVFVDYTTSLLAARPQ